MQPSHILKSIFILLFLPCLVLSGCTPRPTAAPTLPTTSVPVTIPTFVSTNPNSTQIATAAATATVIPFSSLTLKPGDFYFSLDGQPVFTLSRNLTGKTQEDFATLLEWAHQGGTKLIRVHLTHGWWGDPWINPDWSVDEKWAKNWDWFFSQAQADGISVMPVFGVWADWNNGKPDLGSPFWQYNPMNVANGGPLNSPTSLFQSGSDTQNHWFAWVKTLVERWQGRLNIAAWEIFSEINIASGAPGQTDSKGGVSESVAVDFTNKAMAIIRTADTKQRPVTLALATGAPFTNEWGKFYEQNNLDFIEIHPYSDTLDRELVTDVRENLARYNKPLMIGENGLWSTDSKPNAAIGVTHAIWAGLVSGAMNGRAFWGADSYSIYTINDRGQAFQFLQTYATAELPVAHFVSGIDFSGFGPLKSSPTSQVWGAAIGNEKYAIGWYRDATSEPPDWNLIPVVSKQTVTITVPGSAANWQVDFYNTKDGTTILSSVAVSRKGNTITVSLPDFQDDIAFKLYPK